MTCYRQETLQYGAKWKVDCKVICKNLLLHSHLLCPSGNSVLAEKFVPIARNKVLGIPRNSYTCSELETTRSTSRNITGSEERNLWPHLISPAAMVGTRSSHGDERPQRNAVAREDKHGTRGMGRKRRRSVSEEPLLLAQPKPVARAFSRGSRGDGSSRHSPQAKKSTSETAAVQRKEIKAAKLPTVKQMLKQLREEGKLSGVQCDMKCTKRHGVLDIADSR